MQKRLSVAIASVLVLSFGAAAVAAETDGPAYAEEIISMRSSLAKTFVLPGAEVNEDTFKKVCGAIGKRVKEINEKGDVKIRHAATKYRNPVNAATPEEAAIMERFMKEADLKEVSDSFEKDGKRFSRYTRPIYVESACLACHGERDTRPAFVLSKYPDDRAYGFKAGDLRGIISVISPKE
ncbi:MAG: hypothetical protein A2X93_00210 [Deltaproteobacteria bacterium GWC2_56_8]|nr:MAG: hypothetical protein A2X93_00210 [Deltaproteobacteria bacterium GWC2_56_8]